MFLILPIIIKYHYHNKLKFKKIYWQKDIKIRNNILFLEWGKHQVKQIFSHLNIDSNFIKIFYGKLISLMEFMLKLKIKYKILINYL